MDIQIKAEQIKLVAPESLVENPKNRNRHSIEQIERLCKMIRYNGFRNPIIVSNRTGFVVAGHGRLEAAKLLEMEKVPVVYEDFDNEAQEYSYVIGDNEIARWAQLDLHNVHIDLEEIDIPDIELLGMENFKFESLEPEDLSDKNKEIDTDNFGNDLEHTCPKCGFEFND